MEQLVMAIDLTTKTLSDTELQTTKLNLRLQSLRERVKLQSSLAEKKRVTTLTKGNKPTASLKGTNELSHEDLERVANGLLAENYELLDTIRDYEIVTDMLMAKHRSQVAQLQNAATESVQNAQKSVVRERETIEKLEQEVIKEKEKMQELVNVVASNMRDIEEEAADKVSRLNQLEAENKLLRELLSLDFKTKVAPLDT
eukprot:Clim_evm5s77 gene=Clim_evmTU5s77